ncbi:MAG: hypothetical protein GXY44_12890 [Phycisphaerales bacterium]|nr:hypothetical protein [Phycisphaerales bacterium]
MSSEKQNVGLAGEYAVASYLCRKGLYAQLTLGNHKKTDLLVEDTESGHLFCVSVKAKKGPQWPKVKGITRKTDVIVFVDFKNKQANDMPDFYVLNLQAWKKLILKLKKQRQRGSIIDRRTNTLHWPSDKGKSNGYYGSYISPKDIEPYKDAWKKVFKLK